MKESANAFTNSALQLASALDGAMDSALVVQRTLTAIFAMVPHEWKLNSEAEAKRYFLLFMKMAGATINAEVESSNGRADAILETAKAIYIFEFKYGKSVRAALRQCHDRNYAAPFAADTRKVIYVGVNYDTAKKNVDTLNDTPNDTLNDTLNNRIVSLVKQQPGIRRPEMVSILKVSESTIARSLRQLKDTVVFRGASKTGGYYTAR